MKLQRILLIQPPVTSYLLGDFTPNMPLGLAYLGAVLEKENIEVTILDALVEGWNNQHKLADGRFQIGLDFSEIKNRIKDFQPHLVGISSMFTAQWQNAASVAEVVKNIDGNIPVVLGGAHPSAVPEEVLKDKNIDFVVIGEGERAFLRLLHAIEGKERLGSLKSIAFRKNGKIIINNERDYIEDLDSLPFPARHLLPLEKYFEIGLSHGGVRRCRRFSSIVTSRGCPAQCVFCSVHKLWGRKYRTRSPEDVIAEIKLLKDNFGIEELSIEDDNFTLNKERAQRICELIKKECTGIVWDTPNGIALYSIDEGLIRKMQESGCYRISFAVESGNQKFLSEVIKKPLKLIRVPALVSCARRLGLEINVFFVIGVPGETEETIKDTFRFSRRIGVYDPFISIATPYPGTEMLELCVEKGFLVKDFDFSRLTIHQYNIETPALPLKKIKKILKSEYRKMRFYYYLNILVNPKKLIRRILKKRKSESITSKTKI